MKLAELILKFISVILIGGVGLYFSYNYRVQTRLKVLELRVEAYRKLFAITESASPTRLGRGTHLSDEEKSRLGREIYNWYFEGGNGLLMPNETRQHLQWLQRSLQGEPIVDSGLDPMIKEISKLRTLLRQDVGIFGKRESSRHYNG